MKIYQNNRFFRFRLAPFYLNVWIWTAPNHWWQRWPSLDALSPNKTNSSAITYKIWRHNAWNCPPAKIQWYSFHQFNIQTASFNEFPCHFFFFLRIFELTPSIFCRPLQNILHSLSYRTHKMFYSAYRNHSTITSALYGMLPFWRGINGF